MSTEWEVGQAPVGASDDGCSVAMSQPWTGLPETQQDTLSEPAPTPEAAAAAATAKHSLDAWVDKVANIAVSENNVDELVKELGKFRVPGSPAIEQRLDAESFKEICIILP